MICSNMLRLEAGQLLPGTEGEGLEFGERRKKIRWRLRSGWGRLQSFPCRLRKESVFFKKQRDGTEVFLAREGLIETFLFQRRIL